MVMQHYEPEYQAENLVSCLQCQGHSEGIYNQNMIISTLSSKLLVWPECPAEKLHYYVQGQGHRKMSVNVCPDDIL